MWEGWIGDRCKEARGRVAGAKTLEEQKRKLEGLGVVSWREKGRQLSTPRCLALMHGEPTTVMHGTEELTYVIRRSFDSDNQAPGTHSFNRRSGLFNDDTFRRRYNRCPVADSTPPQYLHHSRRRKPVTGSALQSTASMGATNSVHSSSSVPFGHNSVVFTPTASVGTKAN